MSNAEYEHAVTSECLQQSGHLSEDGLPYEQTDTTAAYNPFNLPMGQLTVYRYCDELYNIASEQEDAFAGLTFLYEGSMPILQ